MHTRANATISNVMCAGLRESFRLIIVILSRARSRSIKSIIAANCNFSHPCVLLSTIHAIAFASARPSVKILIFNSFNCEKYHILAFRMFDTDRETQFMHGNFKCGQHVVKLSCEERESVRDGNKLSRRIDTNGMPTHSR